VLRSLVNPPVVLPLRIYWLVYCSLFSVKKKKETAMPRTPNYEGDRDSAEYCAMLFDTKSSWTAEEFEAEGIAAPGRELRKSLVIAYLGQFGWHVRIMNGGARFDGVRLPKVEPEPYLKELSTADEDYFYYPPQAKHLQSLIMQRQPVLTWGDAGCGKTSTVKRLAVDALGAQPVEMSLNGETSLDEFLGSYHMKSGDTVRYNGAALKAMVEKQPLIINELDVAVPEVLFCLQKVLERGEALFPQFCDEYGEPLSVNPWADHSDGRPSSFTVLATANTMGRGDASGMYRGTNLLNEAFLDRFWIFNFDYPPADEEAKILVKRVGVSTLQARCIAQVADLARRAFREGQQLGSSFSIRKSLRWAEAVARLDCNMKEGFQLAVMEAASPEDRAVLEEIYQRVTSE